MTSTNKQKELVLAGIAEALREEGLTVVMKNNSCCISYPGGKYKHRLYLWELKGVTLRICAWKLPINLAEPDSIKRLAAMIKYCCAYNTIKFCGECKNRYK